MQNTTERRVVTLFQAKPKMEETPVSKASRKGYETTIVKDGVEDSQKRYGKNKENPRRKGVISAIINDVLNEKGIFYQSDYTQSMDDGQHRYPPATVQGVFAILKNAGVIRALAGERGKYILEDNVTKRENKRLEEENKRLLQEKMELEKKLASLDTSARK